MAPHITPPRRSAAMRAGGWLLAALCAFQLSPPVRAAPDARAASQATNGTSETAQVLVITGSDPYLPAFMAIDAAARAALVRRHHKPVLWLYESIDSLRLGGTTGPAFAELLARKYEGVHIDAVVLYAEPTVEFYLRHRDRLWPQAGTVYVYVAPAFASRLPADARLSGVPIEADIAGTLRIALALQPKARRVLVIGGISPFDDMQLKFAHAALQPYGERLDIEFLVGPTPQVAAERLRRENLDTIVLYMSLFRDAAGQVHVPRDVVATLSAASGAPIYGTFETYLGHGLAAGAMESFTGLGDRLGELVATALENGPTDASVALPPPSRCLVDGRQLKRFGLRPSALPAGCELRFVEVPLLQRYWWQATALALALVAQSALIASLLLQRRRRRAAEQSLQAQRAQLMHASRLAVAGELTASIAHEINQPLTAILSNAEAAEMMIEAGQAPGEKLMQILGDIRRDDLRASEVIKRLRTLLAGHEVERHRFSLNDTVRDTAALLRTEARRRGVSLETALQAQRADVLGDPVQVQQVIINLCLNAFDAADAALPEERRRVRLDTADTPGGVQLGVRDFGIGIPQADLPRLFESFFTTKPGGMGLGLAIARTIVEAQGGTIHAVRHDAGAEFRVVLPLAPAGGTLQPAATKPA